LAGELVRQDIPKTAIVYNGVNHTRYRNPSGYIPLYLSEIRSFKTYADHYLELRVKEFKLVFYQFFCPLPQQPNTKEDEELYYHYIDNFVKIGGDIITFNPLVRNRVPLPNMDSSWEIAPPGSTAERIIQYAKNKGLKIGFYMGSAPDNSSYCDSPMTEYASIAEKPQWKKVGLSGEISRENCIASDDFFEWFFQVQKNTIKKYGIILWDWDPGPGNGFFCYSPDHGHIAGMGGYKGFRNAMAVVKRLREEFPELYIQGFHGTKEYGLWGFKGFDQHEAYWEQCPGGSVLYPDFSEDRLTASGMRFQSWWNQNFRFMPAVINHSLCHRMTQYCGSPRELLYLFDHLGWKYAVISGLAAGASLTVPLIPYDIDDVYGGYTEFYHKWVQWGRENVRYTTHAIAFGGQGVTGGVDGFAKILGNKGFLFLGNPAPIKSSITFILGDEIGLSEPGSYVLKEIYPRDDVYFWDENSGKGTFVYDDKVTVVVPQYEVLVLELVPFEGESPKLFGISGDAFLEGNVLAIKNSIDEEGGERKGFFISASDKKINSMTVNGTLVSFKDRDGILSFVSGYGEKHLPRYLYNWNDEKGSLFNTPNEKSFDHVSIGTVFFAPSKIKEILNSAAPGNAKESELIVKKLNSDKAKGNFAWALPHRIFMVFPFTDSSCIGGMRAFLNDKPCMLTNVTFGAVGVISYADITDEVRWDEDNTIHLEIDALPHNQFLGAYLYYPPTTSSVVRNVELDNELIISRRIYPYLNLKPWFDAPEKQIRIDNAWIRENLIEEFHPFTVCAVVNYNPDELEGVYLSAQVCIGQTYNTLKRDEKMVFDPYRRLWTCTLHMGNRHLLIIDGEEIHVWAVTKDGYVSPTRKVKIEWKLP
jgi:hypothetical protein